VLLSLLAVPVLAARILVEARFLAERLEGYDNYRERVRFRLIPLLW
jgi:protein-S-isoprenylcysteine O-methyltransferase Ste14